MQKIYTIIWFVIGFASMGFADNKISTQSIKIVSDSLYKKKQWLAPQHLSIQKKDLIEYRLLLKHEIFALYQLVKQVDIDLEYWKNEHYIEHRVPWYYKSWYRQISKKEYHKKISQSIANLTIIKKETCKLLGLFHEYSSYVYYEQFDKARHLLGVIESIFPLPQEEASIILIFKIKKHEKNLRDLYKKYQAPNHVMKYSGAYATASVAAIIAAYLWYQNQDYCKEKYDGFKDFLTSQWEENVSENIILMKNWYNEGLFYPIPKELPEEFLKVLKITSSGALPIKFGADSRDHLNRAAENLRKAKISIGWLLPVQPGFDYKEILNAVYDSLEKAEIGEGLSVGVDEEAAKRLYKNQLYPIMYNAQKRNQGVVLVGLLSSVAIVGFISYKLLAESFDKFFKKNLHLDPARYNIKQLHQIVYASEKLECEQKGALYLHINMLLETLIEFPTDVAQTIYEDSHRLNDIRVAIEEKREIINRWYSTYNFLKI